VWRKSPERNLIAKTSFELDVEKICHKIISEPENVSGKFDKYQKALSRKGL
jgi:PBP1b-binding outer membrane lipoprotein LpoB